MSSTGLGLGVMGCCGAASTGTLKSVFANYARLAFAPLNGINYDPLDTSIPSIYRTNASTRRWRIKTLDRQIHWYWSYPADPGGAYPAYWESWDLVTQGIIEINPQNGSYVVTPGTMTAVGASSTGSPTPYEAWGWLPYGVTETGAYAITDTNFHFTGTFSYGGGYKPGFTFSGTDYWDVTLSSEHLLTGPSPSVTADIEALLTYYDTGGTMAALAANTSASVGYVISPNLLDVRNLWPSGNNGADLVANSGFMAVTIGATLYSFDPFSPLTSGFMVAGIIKESLGSDTASPTGFRAMRFAANYPSTACAPYVGFEGAGLIGCLATLEGAAIGNIDILGKPISYWAHTPAVFTALEPAPLLVFPSNDDCASLKQIIQFFFPCNIVGPCSAPGSVPTSSAESTGDTTTTTNE